MTIEKLKEILSRNNREFLDSCFSDNKKCKGIDVLSIGSGTSMIFCRTHGYKQNFLGKLEE